MLEYFVHLDADDAPLDLVLATAEVPDDMPRKRLAAEELPSNWRNSPAPAELARIGDEFVEEAKSCVLIVPSVLAPQENNWLLNPHHGSFRKLFVFGIEPLSYDPRIFTTEGRRRRRH